MEQDSASEAVILREHKAGTKCSEGEGRCAGIRDDRLTTTTFIKRAAAARGAIRRAADSNSLDGMSSSNIFGIELFQIRDVRLRSTTE